MAEEREGVTSRQENQTFLVREGEGAMNARDQELPNQRLPWTPTRDPEASDSEVGKAIESQHWQVVTLP